MLLKIFKILKKSNLIFSNPPHNKLVVFDDESFESIKELVSVYDYSILQTRLNKINKLYITLKIIFLTFFFYRGNLLSSYLISLITIIKPKIVFTYIDNSLKFSEIAHRFQKIDKKIKFIALQNGSRYEILENQYLFNKNIIKQNINQKFFIPILLSFGIYEKKLFKRLHLKVKKIIPVGNILIEKYKIFKKKHKIKIKKKRQICLLSDHGAWQKKMNETDKNLEKNFILLTNFCLKFALKYKFKIIICEKRAKPKSNTPGPMSETDFYLEKNAYKKYLSIKYYNQFKKALVKRDKNQFSTYLRMEESDVLICTMSTLLRENLNLRNKIFAVNLTGKSIYNFPLNKFFSFNNNNYDNFEKKLLSIVKMSKKEYFNMAGKNLDFCILKNKSPVNKIRSELNKYLI